MLTLAITLAAVFGSGLLTGGAVLMAAGHRRPRYTGRHRAV